MSQQAAPTNTVNVVNTASLVNNSTGHVNNTSSLVNNGNSNNTVEVSMLKTPQNSRESQPQPRVNEQQINDLIKSALQKGSLFTDSELFLAFLCYSFNLHLKLVEMVNDYVKSQ